MNSFIVKPSNYGGGILFSLASGGNLFVAVQMWYPLKARIGFRVLSTLEKSIGAYTIRIRLSEGRTRAQLGA